MEAITEPWLLDYGVQMLPKSDVKERARADLLIQLQETGARFFVDVTVTHPTPGEPGHAGQPEVKAAWQRKFDWYVNSYHVE